MPHPVLDIADEVLRSAKTRGIALTPLQLMKLVYITYGWYWANRDEPLFTNDIEAWKYGPVIPDLYHATKHYGREKIPHDLIADGIATEEDTRAFVDKVLDQYGSLSGIALSNLTHRKGTPWSKVYRDGFFGLDIPPDLIRMHYKRELDDRRNPTAPKRGGSGMGGQSSSQGRVEMA